MLHIKSFKLRTDFSSWYENLRVCCNTTGADQSFVYCNFSQYINESEHGVYNPVSFPNNPTLQQCANKIQMMVSVENTSYTMYVYKYNIIMHQFHTIFIEKMILLIILIFLANKILVK